MTDKELAEEDTMTTTLNDVSDPDEPKEPKPVIVFEIPTDNRLHEQCCDKRACGAEIMVLVKNAKDNLLAFCQHHYNENEPALLGQGFTRVEFTRVCPTS